LKTWRSSNIRPGFRELQPNKQLFNVICTVRMHKMLSVLSGSIWANLVNIKRASLMKLKLANFQPTSFYPPWIRVKVLVNVMGWVSNDSNNYNNSDYNNNSNNNYNNNKVLCVRIVCVCCLVTKKKEKWILKLYFKPWTCSAPHQMNNIMTRLCSSHSLSLSVPVISIQTFLQIWNNVKLFLLRASGIVNLNFIFIWNLTFVNLSLWERERERFYFLWNTIFY